MTWLCVRTVLLVCFHVTAHIVLSTFAFVRMGCANSKAEDIKEARILCKKGCAKFDERPAEARVLFERAERLFDASTLKEPIEGIKRQHENLEACRKKIRLCKEKEQAEVPADNGDTPVAEVPVDSSDTAAVKRMRSKYELHRAILSDQPDAEILSLIHPASAKVTASIVARRDNLTVGSALPLHAAAQYDSEVVVRALLESNPTAAKVKVRYVGKPPQFSTLLPLHLAARESASVAVIRMLLEVHPAAINCEARVFGMGSVLPLHVAANFNRSAAVVSTLVAAYPEAARQKIRVSESDGYHAYSSRSPFRHGCDGLLPLFFAVASNHQSAEVVSVLIAAYPDAVKEPVNGLGGSKPSRMLPLHCAAKGGSTAVISELIAAYPEALNARCWGVPYIYPSDGVTPLHLAAKCNSSEKVSVIIAANPAALRAVDDSGNMPLHYAAGSYERGHTGEDELESVVRVLLQACPDAARHRNKDGDFAVHLAGKNQYARPSLVAMLEEANPSAAEIRRIRNRYCEYRNFDFEADRQRQMRSAAGLEQLDYNRRHQTAVHMNMTHNTTMYNAWNVGPYA